MGAPPMNTMTARLEGGEGGPVAVLGQGEDAIRLPAPVSVDRRRMPASRL